MDRWTDECGAHSVTLRQRGQSSDVATQGLGDGLRLGVTELGELTRCIHHRTVVLAELVLTRREAARLCREPGGVEALDHGIDGLGAAADDRPGATCGEFRDGRTPLGVGKKTQRGEGQIVVGLIACRATILGEGEDLAWPTATAPRTWAVGRLVGRFHEAGNSQRGQRSPNSCGRHPQARGNLRSRRGTQLQQAPRHPLGGFTGEFHNNIVA